MMEEGKGMGNARFSVNGLLVIVIIFSAILFLFTLKLTDLAYRPAVNEIYPVEGSDLTIRYSSQTPNGLYRGQSQTAPVLLEGSFGYDWGAAVAADKLYLNEYDTSDLGMVYCSLVRVDLNTLEKEVLRKDTILRGRCASGELVCLGDCLMLANAPDTNPLCQLYAMTDGDLHPEGEGATVLFLDPNTGEAVYSVWDDEALTDSFEDRYISRTLEEVMG